MINAIYKFRFLVSHGSDYSNGWVITNHVIDACDDDDDGDDDDGDGGGVIVMIIIMNMIRLVHPGVSIINGGSPKMESP